MSETETNVVVEEQTQADAAQASVRETIDSANQASEAVAENDDERLDEILDKGEENRKSEFARGRKRNPDGTFVGKSEDAAEDVEETADEPQVEAEPEGDEKEDETDEVESEEKESTVDVKSDDYRRALHALSREHVPQSILDSMTPEEVVQWGLKRADAQAETDRFGQQLAELKNQKEAEPKVADGPTAEPDFDLGEAAKPLLELFGDEASVPLKAFGSKITEHVTAQANQQMGEMQNVLGAVIGRLEQYELRNARVELTKKYPQFKDDAGFQRAIQEADKLDASKFESMSDLLETGARLAFSEETIAEAAKKRLAMDKKKSMGAPTSRTMSQPPKAVMTEDEAEEYELDRILGGRGRL